MYNNKKIFVTRPFLPPLNEYVSQIEKIWENQHVTNNGPLLQEFEKKLRKLMGVKYVLVVSNATMALQLSLKALDIKKTVITTPFSFAATLNAIIWEKCNPVFADIDPLTFCIDPDKIEEKITVDTEAILAVHVYGIPCNVKKINDIAKKYGLKVIYDGAHSFGTWLGKNSISSFGDISVISFHATKLFHMGEGGVIVTNNDNIAEKISALRDFGFQGNNLNYCGINAKSSELHAAMGLANFPYISRIINKRKRISDLYDRLLSSTTLVRPLIPVNIKYNYAYYPVIFKTEDELVKLTSILEREQIFPRRYFYPSLNMLPYADGLPCPISEKISRRVLCLPLYYNLSLNTVKKISNIIVKNITLKENFQKEYENKKYPIII